MKLLTLENLPYRAQIRVGSHHYAEMFSGEHKVLWLSLPFHPMQLLMLNNRDRYRAWNFNRPEIINSNLTSLTPLALFPYRNNFLLNSKKYLKNYYSFMPGIFRNIKRAGFSKSDFFWFTDPRHIAILRHYEPKKIFYRCVDNLEHFQDIPISILDQERELIRNCDAVFFTSRDLIEKFSGLNKRTFYLPNGCDFDFFHSPTMEAQMVNKLQPFFDHSKINVLYTGAIANWFDFEFLEVASDFKGCHFIIIGPIRTRIPVKLKQMRNVRFLGPIPYKFMPYFAKLSDIAIIPFKVNPMTDSVNPIKLYEYCAAGLPTVVSAFKTVTEMKGPYFVYRRLDEVESCINSAVSAISNQAFVLSLFEFAKQNSWSARLCEIKSVINEVLF